MVKLNWMRFTLLFTLWVSLPTLVAFGDPVKNQSHMEVQFPQLQAQNNPPPVRRDGGSRNWEETFNEVLLNNEPPTSRDGGSRSGGMLCLITPMDEETGVKLWRDRPIFVWKGSLVRLELRNQDSEALIWSQDLRKTDQSVRYTGVALEPGELYTLWLYSSDAYLPDQQVMFRVLEPGSRETINQDLEQLTATLKQQNATPEAIAIAHFQYFAQQGLWSDALSEPFLVENSSSDLNQLKTETIPQTFCR